MKSHKLLFIIFLLFTHYKSIASDNNTADASSLYINQQYKIKNNFQTDSDLIKTNKQNTNYIQDIDIYGNIPSIDETHHKILKKDKKNDDTNNTNNNLSKFAEYTGIDINALTIEQ